MSSEPAKRPARTPARKPTEALLVGLPALERLLTAAAEWLEGVNDARREAEEANAKAQADAEEALKQLEERHGDNSRKREISIQECALGSQSLVGSWFHKLEGGEVAWQGSVVAEPQPGFYLLELHNWKDGSSAQQRIVPIKEMADQDGVVEWRFYDEAEWMRLAGMRTPLYENVDLQEEVK